MDHYQYQCSKNLLGGVRDGRISFPQSHPSLIIIGAFVNVH